MKKDKVDREVTMLIGKKIHRVIACAGFTNTTAILFDDGKTYIHLEEQDYYSYHDCSISARLINVVEDQKQWDIYNEFNPDARSIT